MDYLFNYEQNSAHPEYWFHNLFDVDSDRRKESDKRLLLVCLLVSHIFSITTMDIRNCYPPL
jgi:hypothetical protein